MIWLISGYITCPWKWHHIKRFIPGNDFSHDMTCPMKWHTPINLVLLDFWIAQCNKNFIQIALYLNIISLFYSSVVQCDFGNSLSLYPPQQIKNIEIQIVVHHRNTSARYTWISVQSGLSCLIPKSPFSPFSTYSSQWPSSPSTPGILHPVYPPLSIQYCINASQYLSCKRHRVQITWI